MSTYNVGEIAICKNMPAEFAGYNDSECLIAGGLERRVGWTYDGRFWTVEGYKVVLPDHLAISVPSWNLRKKQPPSREIDAVVAWADCAWSPEWVAT